MHTLGNKSRDLIKVIQKLGALNIDATLPSLPKFVVVGDQSQGKSSIIEAIGDIKLPRGSGTCTRCPYQITTSESKDGSTLWSCKVSLHRKYSYNPVFKAAKDLTKYDRWPEKELEIYDFATITDKSLLEDVLRRAQLAILNPNVDPAQFLPGSGRPSTSKAAVGFSPNVVDLEITGPELPELSFFDLPGAINVAQEASEAHLVPFIEKLIRNYLRDEKTLVLLAISADQDVENSTAFRFVTQCGALDRCMGVLTKPDLLVRSKLAHVRNIINGKIFRLGNGWYITKQLSQEEIESEDIISHSEARNREQGFFSKQPWSMYFAELGSRFGIANLQDAISNKLTEHILKDLPEIMERVQARLREVTTELASFPGLPQSATHAVMDEAQEVVSTIIGHVRGESIDNPFRTAYRKLIRDLRTQLKDGRPTINLSTPGYIRQAICVNLEDDDVGDATPTPARNFTQTPTSSKRRRGDNGQAIPSPLVRQVSVTPRSHVKAESADVGAGSTGPVGLELDDIKEMLDRGSNSGLPDQINPKVIEHIVKQCLLDWRRLVKDLLSKANTLLATTVQTGIADVLAARRQTQLFADVNTIVETLVKTLIQEETKRAMHLVDCEMHKPITYNLLLGQQAEAEKAKLLRMRHAERVDEHYDTLEAKGWRNIPNKQERKKKLDDEGLKATLGPDRYSREVAAMATPSTYYDLASARMLDTIANHLEFGLMYAIETNLRNAMRTGLKVTDEVHCMQLLAEDPERERLRATLTTEKEKLGMALEELEALPHRTAF